MTWLSAGILSLLHWRIFLCITAAPLITSSLARLLNPIPFLCTTSVAGGLNPRWCKLALSLGRCSGEDLVLQEPPSPALWQMTPPWHGTAEGHAGGSASQPRRSRTHIPTLGLALSQVNSPLVFYLWWRGARRLQQSFLFSPFSFVYLYFCFFPLPFWFKKARNCRTANPVFKDCKGQN